MLGVGAHIIEALWVYGLVEVALLLIRIHRRCQLPIKHHPARHTLCQHTYFLVFWQPMRRLALFIKPDSMDLCTSFPSVTDGATLWYAGQVHYVNEKMGECGRHQSAIFLNMSVSQRPAQFVQQIALYTSARQVIQGYELQSKCKA